MQRNLENILISERGEGLKYIPPKSNSGKSNYPPRDSRSAHGERIKSQFELAWKQAEARCEEKLAVSASGRDGIYLQIKGKTGYDLVTKSLESTTENVRVLNIQTDENNVIGATIFIPNTKHDFFIKKIKKYMEKETGTDVVGTIEEINVALVEAFWIGNKDYIPRNNSEWCEIWIRYHAKEDTGFVIDEFHKLCISHEIQIKDQHITFPERIVFGVRANFDKLTDLLQFSSRIAEFRKMPTLASFFTELNNAEQREWSLELKDRINNSDLTDTSVCLLDTGINNGHPILEKLVNDSDKHTIEITRGVEDKNGHGTLMGGIAAFFTLEDKLESMDVINVYHFIESVKMMDRPKDNPEELYGDLTADAINLAMIENPHTNRVICMAITADTTIEKDGRPSSWSGAIDAMIAGVEDETTKLMFISAGNTEVQDIKDAKDYKNAVRVNPVKDPGQAWNAITVGAYTELVHIDDPAYNTYAPVAEKGDISPFTSTSMLWDYKKWPVKPDILLEGGNLAYDAKADFYSEADDLSLLSTSNQYLTGRPFDTISMTSSATAQASCMAANIWSRHPDLWPETIRALMIHAADWTEEMKRGMDVKGSFTKSDYRNLLRTCGYGIPDIEKAMWSASSSVNMIIQDELQPYIKKAGGSVTSNEMHIHTLPWPSALLMENENMHVKMRVTLSFYIEPGPGEIGWKDKYRYPSCNLLFDVNNPLEDRSDFVKRISTAMREDDEDKSIVKNDSSRWTLGANNRKSGSIHSDIWEGTASQLSYSNLIIVYPIGGWWKTRTNLKRYHSKIRYSLVVTIEAPEIEIDLYTAIQTEIKNKNLLKIEVSTKV